MCGWSDSTCLRSKVTVFPLEAVLQGGRRSIHRTSKWVVPAYHAIVLPRDRRHFEALLLRRGPRLRKDTFDDRCDRVCGQAHRPREVRDGVVLDDIAEVTPALHRVPGNAARREFARAGAHGNGVRSVPYVRDVVCRRLYDDESEVSADYTPKTRTGTESVREMAGASVARPCDRLAARTPQRARRT